jgi:hypothetical protein
MVVPKTTLRSVKIMKHSNKTSVDIRYALKIARQAETETDIQLWQVLLPNIWFYKLNLFEIAMHAFLLSAGAAHINGQHVFVDGGYVHLDRAMT